MNATKLLRLSLPRCSITKRQQFNRRKSFWNGMLVWPYGGGITIPRGGEPEVVYARGRIGSFN